MPEHKTPKKAGIWELVDDGPTPTSGEDGRFGWLHAAFVRGEIHRAILLVTFLVLGTVALVLGGTDLSGAPPLAVLAAILQIVVFVFLVLLTIQTRGANPELFWLGLVFAAVVIYAVGRLDGGDGMAAEIRRLAVAAGGLALAGYGVRLGPEGRTRRVLGRVALVLWLLLIAIGVAAWQLGRLEYPSMLGVQWAASLLPFVIGVTVLIVWPRAAAAGTSRSTLVFLLILHLLHLLDLTGQLGDIASPLLLPLFAGLAFYGVIQVYTQDLRSLAFFGRFIRPGLKRLLAQQRIRGSEKLFRGRKTVIMKIDMASFTRTTFDMPYGMRRLFQDLWFTLIDHVVADKVFLDKSLGDGSLYCFEDSLPGGSCSVALATAIDIRDRQVGHFDETFRQRLRAQLAAQPELRVAAERYLADYEARTGESFWNRRTLVRIALVTGYVDEGLWGLSSQSHYDVQGPPIILASRLEPEAMNGEIVFDQRFLDELEDERDGRLDRGQLTRRQVALKGIGAWDVWSLAPGSTVLID
ncbi:MAG: hypothetical protein AAGD38_00925 [Acidobacteriota bacterium]